MPNHQVSRQYEILNKPLYDCVQLVGPLVRDSIRIINNFGKYSFVHEFHVVDYGISSNVLARGNKASRERWLKELNTVAQYVALRREEMLLDRYNDDNPDRRANLQDLLKGLYCEIETNLPGVLKRILL